MTTTMRPVELALVIIGALVLTRCLLDPETVEWWWAYVGGILIGVPDGRHRWIERQRRKRRAERLAWAREQYERSIVEDTPELRADLARRFYDRGPL